MPPERRAVLLLLSLAVAGQGVRTWASRPLAAPGELLALPGIGGQPLAHRDSSLAAVRPLAAGEQVDLDLASAEEIARLPRIGLALARAMVTDRLTRGPFGSLAGLDRVAGVGPGLLRAIGPHARFSLAPTQPAAALGGSPADGSGTPGSDGRVAQVAVSGAAQAVNINTATAAELEELPFIGAYMAQQIVVFRERHGPFAAVESLVAVPGIGPSTLGKVRERVVVE
ncbi:MAG: helix-hairpin-helix domain-containing protein [Gemmatimonadales bacterium]